MWGYGPGGGMGYGGWGGGGMMLLGGAFWLVLIVLGIMAIVWILRASTHGLHHNASYPPRIDRGSAGLDILEERYARGEIDREEYLQKRADLKSGR